MMLNYRGRIFWIFILIMVLGTFNGCGPECDSDGNCEDDEEESGWSFGMTYQSENALPEFKSVQLSGNLGTLYASHTEVKQTSIYREQDYSNIEVIVSHPSGSGKVMLSLHGDVLSPTFLRVGHSQTFKESDWRQQDFFEKTSPTFISATGSSGPEMERWEWDVPAREVTVEVEEADHPDAMLLNVYMTFPQSDSYNLLDGKKSGWVDENTVHATIEVDMNTL